MNKSEFIQKFIGFAKNPDKDVAYQDYFDMLYDMSDDEISASVREMLIDEKIKPVDEKITNEFITVFSYVMTARDTKKAWTQKFKNLGSCDEKVIDDWLNSKLLGVSYESVKSSSTNKPQVQDKQQQGEQVQSNVPPRATGEQLKGMESNGNVNTSVNEPTDVDNCLSLADLQM